MSNGIFIPLSGAVAQERALDVIANNLANASTTGFRGDHITFKEYLSEKADDSPAPESMRFVHIDRISPDLSQGTLRKTGNPLDVAIQGEGFFELQTSQGPRYSRAGSFVTDSLGTLRTMTGYEVSGSGGSIQIPQGTREIRIEKSGEVFADNQEVGKIKVVKFQSTKGLKKEGQTMYQTDLPPVEVEPNDMQLEQAYLESSNVNAIQGMHQMITISRSFDALQKSIDTFRQMDRKAAEQLGSKSG